VAGGRDFTYWIKGRWEAPDKDHWLGHKKDTKETESLEGREKPQQGLRDREGSWWAMSGALTADSRPERGGRVLRRCVVYMWPLHAGRGRGGKRVRDGLRLPRPTTTRMSVR
jgi:hypothetical protein